MNKSLSKTILSLFIILTFVYFLIGSLSSAFQVGRVTGQVVDEDGNPIVGAQITAQNPNKLPSEFKAETDKKGNFVIIGMPSGEWGFTVIAEGYTLLQVVHRIFAYQQNEPIEFVLKKATGEETVTEGVHSGALLNKGNALYEKGKYEEALQAFLEFKEKNPELYQIYFNIANSYKKLEQYDKAIEYYAIFLEKEPQSVEAFYNIAESYVGKNDLENAEIYFNKVVEQSPQDSAVYYNFAEVYYGANEIDKAIELYKKALEIRPDWSKAHLKLGYAYLNKGENQEAVKHLEKFLELEPESSDAEIVKELLKNIKSES
jgi:tetratricopeptide (TPR) repeat protein